MTNKKTVKSITTKNISTTIHVIRNEAYSYAKHFVQLNCHQMEITDLVDDGPWTNRAKIIKPETVVVLVGLNRAAPGVVKIIQGLVDLIPSSSECHFIELPNER